MKKTFCLCVILLILANISFAQVSLIGELTREATLQPGEKFEGEITLKNRGETPWEVTVYKNDYLFYADGTIIYGEPGEAARTNAGWLSLSPNALTILPDETASIFYTLQVPDDQDLSGTYWSIIMIEPTSETGPQVLEDKEHKLKIGIQTRVRYAVQIITNIGDAGAPEINFLDKKLIHEDGKRILQLDVENSGERWLSPAVRVELYDDSGNRMARSESKKKRIYPECSVRYDVDLTEVPPGDYRALVVLDNGDEHVFGAQYDLRIQ